MSLNLEIFEGSEKTQEISVATIFVVFEHVHGHVPYMFCTCGRKRLTPSFSETAKTGRILLCPVL